MPHWFLIFPKRAGISGTNEVKNFICILKRKYLFSICRVMALHEILLHFEVIYYLCPRIISPLWLVSSPKTVRGQRKYVLPHFLHTCTWGSVIVYRLNPKNQYSNCVLVSSVHVSCTSFIKKNQNSLLNYAKIFFIWTLENW